LPTEGSHLADNLRNRQVEEYVTRTQQVFHVKPSQLFAALAPFSTAPAKGIIPLDSDRSLVLHDHPENIRRMLELIGEIDVVKMEFAQEVILIQFAKAADIAAALNNIHDARKKTLAGEEAFESIRSNDIAYSGQKHAIPDGRSNSVLLCAEQAEFDLLKQAASRLDLAQAQVLIEVAIVATATGTRNRRNGTGSQRGFKKSNEPGDFLAFIDFDRINANNVSMTSTNGTGFTMRLADGIEKTLARLAGDSRFKILQRPRIQTCNNETATIFVGPPCPYPAATCYVGGSNGGHTSSVLNATGLTLDLNPVVHSEGLVVMEIHQTIGWHDNSVHPAKVQNGPVPDRRGMACQISVHNRETFVLRGMNGNASRAVSRILSPKDNRIERTTFQSFRAAPIETEIFVLICPRILPHSAANNTSQG
jgi:type II secretory pathway component GspD/PulD (secretin)